MPVRLVFVTRMTAELTLPIAIKESSTMRAFCADDLFQHRTLTALTGSGEHCRLVFQLGRALRKQDGYERTLWGFSPEDSSPRRLTSPLFEASSPSWSPDGNVLAFVSKRLERGMQVHLLGMNGGEATQLTDAEDETPTSIEGWSSDGLALLALAKVDWQEDGELDPPDGTRAPQVARFLPYKLDGDGVTVGARTHLYRIDASSGDLAAMTCGDFDVSLAAWSPDATRVAFARNRSVRQRHRQDVWVCEAGGDIPVLVVNGLASVSAIAWSLDGRSLALIGTEQEGDSRAGLWLADVENGSLRQLVGKDLEVEPAGGVQWHPDGKRMLVVSNHHSLLQLAVVDPATDKVERWAMGLRHVMAVVVWGQRIALVAASMRKPEEIHSVDLTGGDLQRHTRFNLGWFAKRGRPRVAKRRFVVPNGAGGEERIDAWVLTPPARSPPYPLLVDMHGGPHSVVLVDYAAHAYWYELCSQGWAIVAPNAVGSQGFGRAFSERLRGHWGQLDLPQFEAVIRQLQDEGFADDRIACTGKSYGGFLSAWAVGHSKLFKAAVVAAPVANVLSHFGTSDTGFYVTPFAMDGESHEQRSRYDALSPVNACYKVTAAVQILQGENDGRCPRGQSEEVFAHLIRYTDAPVEMVIYPQGTHAEAESGRPSNRVDYHTRIVKWVNQWID